MLLLLLHFVFAGDPQLDPQLEDSPVQAQNLSDLAAVLEKSGAVDAEDVNNLKKTFSKRQKAVRVPTRLHENSNPKDSAKNLDPQAIN